MITGILRPAMLAMAFALSGCGIVAGGETYPLPVDEAFRTLQRLDFSDGLTDGRHFVAADDVVLDLVPEQAVTWRFMNGSSERFRVIARLIPAGEAASRIALEVDGSASDEVKGFIAERQIQRLFDKEIAAALSDELEDSGGRQRA
jgi:hypothetical protein